MSWIPLAERFSTLPLILAGPILRRTEPRAVNVWVALKEAKTVTLRVYSRDDTGHLIQQFEGMHSTIRLGDHLHIVAVTARPSEDNDPLLEKMLALVRLRAFNLWWSVPRYMDLRRSPHAIVFPAQGWPKGAFNSFPPDRSYRLHYLQDGKNSLRYQDVSAVRKKAQVSKLTFSRWLLQQAVKIVSFFQRRLLKTRSKLVSETAEFQKEYIPLPQRISALIREIVKGTELLEQNLEMRKNGITDAIVHREEWLEHLKAGMNIVGYNNLGEISFEWAEDKKSVAQRLWWWHPDNPIQPGQATKYSETLDLPAYDAAPPLP